MIYQVSFHFLESFGISRILTLSNNARLKLNRVLLIKSCIEQNILLPLFMLKIRVILYCIVLKVFSFKVFSSFNPFATLTVVNGRQSVYGGLRVWNVRESAQNESSHKVTYIRG